MATAQRSTSNTNRSSRTSPAPGDHRGSYGVDAPYVPALLLIGGAALITYGALSLSASASNWFWVALGVLYVVMAVSYLYTTLAGKFRAWNAELDRLALVGDESVLDVGCGRGLLVTMVARRLVTGTAYGVDIWSTHDQSGNAEDTTRENARVEGVSDRVELRTADMRELPFDDGTFDLVVSNAAIHNIKVAGERARAVREAYRVTKPGGRLALGDLRHTKDHARTLGECGAVDVERRSLGWRAWFGAPIWATRVVHATKPEH
jgi:arsenite methyltransferase